MKRIVALALVALLSGGWSHLQAQEEAEPGQLINVVSIEVDPAHAAAFESVVETMVEAANQANLSQEHGWWFSRDAFTYTLVFPFESMSYWDDPEQWDRQFAGTPGEATMQKAYGMMQEIEATTLNNQIVQAEPDWAHVPGSAMEFGGYHWDQYWLKPGKQQAFDELSQEAIAMMGRVDYPYPVRGYRPRFGGNPGITFVTNFDDLSSYYANDLDGFVEAAGLEEEWGEIVGKFMEMVDRVEHGNAMWVPEMSYWPEDES